VIADLLEDVVVARLVNLEGLLAVWTDDLVHGVGSAQADQCGQFDDVMVSLGKIIRSATPSHGRA
jgi:hypothetical protein